MKEGNERRRWIIWREIFESLKSPIDSQFLQRDTMAPGGSSIKSCAPGAVPSPPPPPPRRRHVRRAAPSYCCQKRLLFSRKLCLSQWRGSKWRVEGHENYAVSLFCLLLVPHDCKKNHHRPKFCHCVFLQCTKTRAVRLFHVLMRNGSKKTSFLFLLWSFPIVMAAAAS